jgi:hypothetical protein
MKGHISPDAELTEMRNLKIFAKIGTQNRTINRTKCDTMVSTHTLSLPCGTVSCLRR